MTKFNLTNTGCDVKQPNKHIKDVPRYTAFLYGEYSNRRLAIRINDEVWYPGTSGFDRASDGTVVYNNYAELPGLKIEY